MSTSRSRYNRTNRAVTYVVPGQAPLWGCLVREFARGYNNAGTRCQYETELAALFGYAGVDHPAELTESAVLEWCGLARANNTVRNQLSRVCTFLRWCVRQGEVDPALAEVLMGRDNPLRQIPRLYGKVQAPQPARWLSHEEAFERLIGACRDGTDLGLRDEAIIRLGLAGMRAAEIIHVRIADLRLRDPEPRIAWIGKKRRARRVVPGPSLIACLDRLALCQEQLLGRTLRSDCWGAADRASASRDGGTRPLRPGHDHAVIP